MTKQKKHTRTSKNGVVFVAGQAAEPAFMCEKALMLKKMIKSVSDYLPEPLFMVQRGNLIIRDMDPANVLLLNYKFRPGGLFNYIWKKSIKFRIEGKGLYQSLKDIKKDDNIWFLPRGNNLHVYNNTKKQDIVLPMLELGKENNVPDISKYQTTKIYLDSINFFEMIRDSSKFADNILFDIDKEFHYLAKGELSKVDSVIPFTWVSETTYRDPAKAKFSLEYLKKLLPISQIYPRIELLMYTDAPLELHFFDARRYDDLQVFLAPRVENE